MALPECTDGSVLALLKSIDGCVLTLLRLSSIFSHHNSTVGEFWCTIAIMQEKQKKILFKIECTLLPWPAVHCNVMHYNVLQCTAMHCNAVQCTAMHYNALQCTAMKCTVLNCSPLHCSKLCIGLTQSDSPARRPLSYLVPCIYYT